eukprot:scaffold28635_cov66-Phaeocystis_antarctica.AAC.1
MHSNRASMRLRAARGALSFRTTGVSPARPHVHSFDGAGQERVNHVCCEYQLVVLPRGLLPYVTFPPATPCLFAPERVRVTGHMPLVQLHGLRQAQAWPDLRPDPARRRGVPLSEQLLSGLRGEDPPAGLHLLGLLEHSSSAKARLTLGTNPWFASDGQPGTHVSDERQSVGHTEMSLQASHG